MLGTDQRRLLGEFVRGIGERDAVLRPARSGEARLDAVQIERQRVKFTIWHVFSERLLRQHTVASFEEMLLQSDRAVVYRGSVQKSLFLADWLMNEFAERIRGGSLPPMFSAMYDAESRIFSFADVGFVRIPARHLFTLPAVIPDLWHEVGVHWFYQFVPRAAFGSPARTT